MLQVVNPSLVSVAAASSCSSEATGATSSSFPRPAALSSAAICKSGPRGWLTAVLDTAAATGDFRWTSGNRRFNLGLFRGLAGVGYTVLRRVDGSLPNVLIWA